MNKEKKFHKMIRSRDADNREKILDKIKAEYPQYFDAPKKDKKCRISKRTLAICCSVGAVAVCAAVILPFVLPHKDAPAQNDSFYATEQDYTISYFDKTLKAYAEQTKKNILYFDWYDYAEVYETSAYIENDTQRVLSIQESVATKDDDAVILQLTEYNVYIVEMNYWQELCVNERIVNSVPVKWAKNDRDVFGIFEYDDYRYYFTLTWNTDEERFFELIDLLLEDK